MRILTKFGILNAMSANYIRISWVLGVVVILLSGSALAGDFTYTTNSPNTNTLTITGNTDPVGMLIIPETIGGRTVTDIGGYSFYSCTGLTNVVMGNSVTQIGDGAFMRCYSLTNVIFPDSITQIGDWAFFFCSSLNNAIIGSNVTSLGEGIFAYCTNLLSITVSENNPAYSSSDGVLFDKGQQTLIQCAGGKTGSYIFPGSVTNIVGGAFSGCASLTNISISTNCTYIDDSALQNCSGLTSITIPDSVTHIGSQAFDSCDNLTSITIPDSVVSIDGLAFYFCDSLTNAIIGSNVTSLGVGIFASCTNLLSITVSENNPALSSLDGVLFDKNQQTILQCPGATEAYTIPQSVTRIDEWSFESCVRLSQITISGSVTEIAETAFSSCISLSSVTLGNSVTNIASGAFSYCTNLTQVELGNSFTTMGGWFSSCENLSKLVIPAGVTNIENLAFSGCAGLSDMYFLGDSPAVGWDIFNGAENVTVYYMPGTTGWGATLGDRTTVLWNPELQHGGSFGVHTNGFGFTITGSSNLMIAVEASTSITNPVWSRLGTNTLVDGSSDFLDSDWTHQPSRYYRLSAP